MDQKPKQKNKKKLLKTTSALPAWLAGM